ncbi:IS3 family transposase [Paenibacillus illinoisensis]|uniref:IS3 family transposase n=1 Tax=Paenibacillus illinoisensis TaxID=59845 RepID=UPI003D29BA72
MELKLEAVRLVKGTPSSGLALEVSCSFPLGLLQVEKKHTQIGLSASFGRIEVEQQASEYLLFYNQNRFKKKLNDRSPVEYREAAVT